MISPLHLTELFETPLIVCELRDATDLNRALKAAIVRQRTTDKVNTTSAIAWRSDRNMLDWGGAPAAEMLRHIEVLADNYSQDIGSNGESRFEWSVEMWATISGRGQSLPSHCHAGSFWNATYYVDDGYAGSADRTLGGELELEDPRMPMILMEGPDLRFRPNAQSPIAATEVLLRPATGRLLLFPAWLRHSVRPFHGRDEHISLSATLTPLRR